MESAAVNSNDRHTRILIVDDDPRNLRILQEILEDDFTLATAESGRQALEQLPVFKPDLVLLDIMMPDIDGLEVCRRIRADERLRFVKVMLVSGKARLEERLEGYQAGADDYVTKPFDDEELLAKVRVFAKLKTTEEVDQLKTDFLRLISHETGTPLTAIIALSSLLLNESGLSEADRDVIRQIRHAGEQLGDKIERILLLSALRRSREFERHPIYTRDLIEAALQRVGTEADARGVTLAVEEAAEHTLTGSYELLQKALAYLLENAVKYSPEGGRVRITQERVEDRLTLHVHDSGPGIDEAAREHLFEIFPPTDLEHHHSGLGISLALAREIVEAHGGTLEAGRSELEGGAVFSITLPCEADGGEQITE